MRRKGNISEINEQDLDSFKELIAESEVVTEDLVVDEVVEMVEVEVLEIEPVYAPTRYKLNLRRNGSIRAEISKSVVYNLNVNWPDLVRVIPDDKWVTVDEVVGLIKVWENSSPRKTFTRTREDIEQGLQTLLESGVLLHG